MPTLARIYACLGLLALASGCRPATTVAPTPTGSVEPVTSDDEALDVEVEPTADPEATTAEEPDPSAHVEVILYLPDRTAVAEARCDAVRPVHRSTPSEPDVPTLTVRILLGGPTEAEMSTHDVLQPFGHQRFGNPDLKDLSAYFTGVEVEGERAFVDFDDPLALEYILSDTSCGRETVLTSIEQTLRALRGIVEVRYRVEGREIDLEGGA